MQSAKTVASYLPDLMMAAGAGAVAYGSSLIYEPMGAIVGGLFLMTAAWMAARGEKK